MLDFAPINICKASLFKVAAKSFRSRKYYIDYVHILQKFKLSFCDVLSAWAFFAATQPLKVHHNYHEQSSRSLFKSLEDALRLDKDNRTKVLSSLADVDLGLPDLCLSAIFPVSSFFFKMFCTAQRLIFSFLVFLFENTPLRSN